MGCIYSAEQTSQVRRITQPRKSYYHSRLSTKFLPRDVRVVSDEERRNGCKPAYACPICFLYYNKILACSECANFVCFTCFKTYEKKMKKDMKCPFCCSGKSLFIDHQLEAHSYFDTTNNGFLNKEERKKVDEEMGQHPSRLNPVNEEQEQQANAAS